MVIDIEKRGYNRKEAAKYIGVAENTLVKLEDSNLVNCIKFGRRKIYPKTELDRFLESSLKKS